MKIVELSSLDYESTSKNIGILFERFDRDSSITLPSQVNTVSVSNITNYGVDSEWTPLKNLKFGKIVRDFSGPCGFDVFCDVIKSGNINFVELFQSYSSFQEPDSNGSCDSGRYIVKPQKNLSLLAAGDKFDKFLNKFFYYPDGFSINPKSDVNVETRIKGDNERYEASLGLEVCVGQSGKPALKNQFWQTLIAEIKR